MNPFERLKHLFRSSGPMLIIDEAQEVIGHEEAFDAPRDFLPPPSLSVERNRSNDWQVWVPRATRGPEKASAFYHAIIRYGARTGRGATREAALRMSDLDSELFREILAQVEAERREAVKAALFERIEDRCEGDGSLVIDGMGALPDTLDDTIDAMMVPFAPFEGLTEQDVVEALGESADDSTETSAQEARP